MGNLAFLFFFLISLISSSYGQNCSSYVLSNRNRNSNRLTSCNNLPVLNASIHWNYNPNDRTVDIAYRHTGMTRSNWIAWSLNPTGRGMPGAQALVAFFNSSGSFRAYTSPITGYNTTLQEAPLSFPVPSIAAEFTNNQIMTIYATIQLPQGNSTSFTQVWQHGDVSGNIPRIHSTTGDHVRSVGTIDFATAAEQPITPPPSPSPPTTTAPPATTSGENNCPAYTFSNRIYRDCSSLPVLSSFLHWNYNQGNRTVDIAYRHTGMTRSNWIAWSLNPTGPGMIGAQALVAFFNSSGALHAYTSPITAYGTTLQEAPLSFQVPSIGAEFANNDQMIIYATIVLPEGSTSFTQVWQHGDVSGTTPLIHPTSGDHVRSISRIDFATGATSGGASVGGSRQRKRNVHGVLNVVSWGILMPLGAMAARYMKVFKSANPAWFYLHVACQCSAYIVGVAGWGTGLKLGSDSAGVEHSTHRNIGITLFALGTLQVFALLLRPKPDHKYRFYWNIYHYAIGYTVISLSIANIFEGFDVLDPEKKWKRAYIGVLIFMGATALVLEAFTWFIVIKRKRESPKHPQQQNGNGNGYHA